MTVDIVTNSTMTNKNTERLNTMTFTTGTAASTVKILDYTATGTYPTGVGGARMVYYNATTATTGLYRFGGYNGSFISEFWKFDLNSSSGTYRTWVRINTSGAPSARYEHFMFIYNSKIYVGFGWSGSSFLNDLKVYDPIADTWGTVTQNGTIPAARQSDAYDVNGTNFYMMGGLTSGGTRLADCQKLDLTTMTWSLISNGAFTARTNFSAVSVGQYVYFYGGDTGTNDNNLFRLDTTNNTISQLTVSGTNPGALYSHRLLAIGTTIYMYGGIITGGATTNTLWTINVSNPASISYGTSYPNLLSYTRAAEAAATDGTVLYYDDGNVVGPGASYSETWSVTTSGVATQLPTKQIYVNATSFTYNGVTFTARNIGGTTKVTLSVADTVASSGNILSLQSLRVNP